jgi:hypothetical protein
MPARGTIKPVAAGMGYRDIGFNAAYDGPGVAVHGIEIDGPLVETWPPPVQTRLFGNRDLKTGTPADAKSAFEKLLPSLFRRPVTADEVRFYVGFVTDRVAAGDPFPKAFRAAVRVALCSPDFLFMRAKSATLDGPELAARLSYLLWSSCPDDALTAAARRGDLADREKLLAQVDRMLADPKAARFRDQFVGQWLGLRQIDATVPDAKLYPEFDDHLLASMAKETLLFVGELLDRDLPVRNLVDSDWTFLDGRLARHYGIPGVDGLDFRKVPLKPESHRGGVLTHASLLKATANGSTTSPVVRGNWVLSAVLGRPIKRPPPDVPAIEPDTRGTTTVRQLLAKHRESAACAGCHNRIDPPGLALESYDPIGAYRTYFRTTAGGPKVEFKVAGRSVGHHKGPAVDPSGTLANGETFADLAGLKKHLLADERAVAANLAGKLLEYATGAAPGVADRAAVAAIVDRAKPSGYGVRTILHEVIASELFRTR